MALIVFQQGQTQGLVGGDLQAGIHTGINAVAFGISIATILGHHLRTNHFRQIRGGHFFGQTVQCGIVNGFKCLLVFVIGEKTKTVHAV